MGGDDTPFSQRMWGIGRPASPRPGVRHGRIFVLILEAIVLVMMLIVGVIAGTL